MGATMLSAMNGSYRAARGLRFLNIVVAVAVTLGVFVGLAIALGPAIPALTFGLMVLFVAARWRQLRELRRLARRDRKAYDTAMDRGAARLGKYYAAASLLVMGGAIVLIIAIFATHG